MSDSAKSTSDDPDTVVVEFDDFIQVYFHTIIPPMHLFSLIQGE